MVTRNNLLCRRQRHRGFGFRLLVQSYFFLSNVSTPKMLTFFKGFQKPAKRLLAFVGAFLHGDKTRQTILPWRQPTSGVLLRLRKAWLQLGVW